MSSWRDQILKEFTPKVTKLTLVADPDGLLLEEGILEGIRERGYELIPFEDHIAFRYAYESKFRSRWDRGEQTDLVVVLCSQATELNILPFDLLQAGRKLSFNLGDIFPSLSYPVVATLNPSDLDALYEAQKRHAPSQLGDNASKEFILRHVFGIVPELVKQPYDLMRMLLRRHYQKRDIPADIDARLIQLLRQISVFDDWPLETIVDDREAFFTFLQERWPIFLDRKATKGVTDLNEDEKPHELSIQGTLELPFDHQDIRVYIDNLFVEGMLHTVTHKHADTLLGTWAGIGVRKDHIEDINRRLDRLIDGLGASIPTEEAKHTDWLHFARGWAQLILQTNNQDDETQNPIVERMRDLKAKVDVVFSAWLIRRFAGLVNLPPVPPVMLHHLPRFLARKIEEDCTAKIALIVVDGLAIDQWLVVREALTLRQPGFQFREQAVFAWVPSLTSVSRQTIFAGKAPIFFPNSIHTTDKEPSLWIQFWECHGFKPNQVIFMKGLGEGDLGTVSDALSHPKARIAGLVVDKVDKIMHGMEMGAAGMLNQVSQWAKQPYLKSLINLLLEQDFMVYLTSDHGNVEAHGCGCPSEGAVADLRGERARIYSDAVLRRRVKDQFSDAIEWGTAGLPENYLALLAPARRAFIREGQRAVSHGGVSVEELIVPLIQIERRFE